MKKKILHLVVGFEINEYFKNSIKSIIFNDNQSDILVISTGTPLSYKKFFFSLDKKKDNEIENFIGSLKVKNKIFYFNHHNLKKFKNFQNLKCGLLYSAYNFAFHFSKKKYEYLNIIQNDMQLLFWNKKIINLIDRLFSINNKVLQISTSFPKKSSQSNFYEINKPLFKNSHISFIKKKILFLRNYGILDTGIIHLRRALSHSIIWKKDETYMSNAFKKRGFKVLHSPIPFTSFLPWPAYVRRGFVIQTPHQLNNKYLFLKNTKKNMFDNLNKFKGELWQEDWVKPYLWYSLEPNMYTEFNFIEYFKILIKYKNKFKKLPLLYVSYNDNKNIFINFTSKNIRPRIFNYLFFHFFKKINGIIFRLIKIFY